MKDSIYYPLTSPQLSIWYTERMYPNTSISNVAGTLRIKEAVDIDLLDKAINLFIKNNDGMRLRICLNDEGTPQQYVMDYEYRRIEVKDFSNHNNPIKAMQEWDREETLKPFKLLNSDLYRFIIIKIDDNDAGFFFNFHHIITDAWSLSVVKNGIVSNYMNLKNGTYVEDVNQIVQSYISFIENEQIYKNTNRYQKDRIFWEQQFASPPEVTVLKTRKSNQISIKSKRKTFIAPKKFTNKLKTFCEENKITPYPLFLSALAMYINRTTEKENLIIGTPILNRLNQTEKNTVGMFISTIPLCINIKSEDSFSSFSQAISEICMAVYRHQRFSYEHILRNVREKYGLSENLYDVVLSYQNSKVNKESDSKCISRWHFSGYQSNSLTIHINDRDNEGVLILDYDYHSDLYYDKEIEFIHQHILSLLWHALDNPDNLICKIEMLTESEKKKILYEFNNTSADYPREKTIHQIFEEQVEKTPDNIALFFEDKNLTYKEFNQKANQVAWALLDLGVEPDIPIGVIAYRSFDMMIAILAILKAGGAYVPIDPNSPRDRIDYLVENSGIKLILTSLSDDFKIDNTNIYSVSYLLQKNSSMDNLPTTSNSNNIAYIIYTSGSTGRPKGVMIEHFAVVNRLNWMQKEYPINESDTILQKTPYTFDVSVWELFWWFFVGAKLALLVPQGEKNPEAIISAIIKYRITTMHFVPSMLNSFIEYLNAKSSWYLLASINRVFSSGEALSVETVNEFYKNTENMDLINLYGPTEATVDVSYFKCMNTKSTRSIPIGKPIDNIQLYILDSHLNMQPIGVAGELYIAGDGLARGYINNQELTQKAFIPNPFSKGKRMYKTGDLARWYAQGDIEYIGRIDHQIKIRGNRVELNEIKHQILKDKSVKDALVICKEHNNSKHIYAYVIFNSEGDLDQIKAQLKKVLPSYMVPSFLVEVKEFPLSSNGKVDFKKLPEPSIIVQEREEALSEIERELISLWEDILKVNIPSVNSDFFESGGDSLAAIQLITRIDNITIEDVYQNPTIRELAKIIDGMNKIDNQILVPYKKFSLKKQSALVCFPYGGGSSIVYKDLFDEFSKFDEGYNLFSVNLPGHTYNMSEQEFISLEEASDLIVEQLEQRDYKEVVLYGHCVGSALTILTATKLQKTSIRVKSIYLGGILLPKAAKYFGKYMDPWAMFSDNFILNYLKKVGLDKESIPEEVIPSMLNAFRYDVKSYYRFFHQFNPNRFNKEIPIYSIIGENDPMTKNYKVKYKNWSDFTDIVKCIVIPGANHYFVKTHALKLANILIDSMEELVDDVAN